MGISFWHLAVVLGPLIVAGLIVFIVVRSTRNDGREPASMPQGAGQTINPDNSRLAETFWSASGRANTVIALLAVALALTAAGAFTSLSTLAFLRRIERGEQITESEANRIDTWSQVFAIPAVIVGVVLAVIYLMWVYRAHLNLKFFTADRLNFSPGWAVGWWFIPFANLVQPARVMGEIWRYSDPRHGAGWSSSGAPALLVIWWLAFLADGVLGRLAFRFNVRATELPDLIRAANFNLASELWGLVAIPLAIGVVVIIKRAQQQRLAALGLRQ